MCFIKGIVIHITGSVNTIESKKKITEKYAEQSKS